MPAKNIVVLGGDGVGPEVMDVTCMILDAAGFDLEMIKPLCGAEALKAVGNPFPEEARKLCDESDAVLFGAAEGPSIAILVYLRWVLDNYINLRPIKYYPGARSPLRNPEGIDFCIIRENSEGLYPGREGDVSWLAQNLTEYKDLFGHTLDHYSPGKFAFRLITEKGTERIARYGSELARQRKASGFPGKVTCITKSNVLFQTCGLFRQIVEGEIKRYSELAYEHYYVDDAARRIVRFPHEFDVIITSNMFGDILADEAAEVVGGLGIAPSACLGGSKPYFEPVHGSAPDIAGRGIVNPTAMILSAKMMLEHLGMQAEADALEKAVAEVYRGGTSLTEDQGGKASTKEFAQAVLKHIR
ncbi:MAG TPA: isocitrate/isopropylmalate dehydrogenase family protein [Desulfomonilia bacterium]|nr:isocitrate/isopropylmalate dehydrogenase family protein [Desulfomonilia bacterium]